MFQTKNPIYSDDTNYQILGHVIQTIAAVSTNATCFGGKKQRYEWKKPSWFSPGRAKKPYAKRKYYLFFEEKTFFFLKSTRRVPTV